MERQLDEIFEQYDRPDAPGLVVGIARGGTPFYRRAFGAASIESGVANTVHTRMRIGSSTKQFTCFAVLLLAEDGALSLDDDIRRHLPELPEYPAPVRIRHLMSNTGGLRCYLDLIGILASMDRAVPAPLTSELQVRQRTVNFPAGERLLYCNGGYLLLSRLVERVAGMPFASFLSKRIFEPLGLRRTVFEPEDTKLLQDLATLHQRYPDGSYHRGTIGAPLTGDGAIISDVDDMLRWLAHMDAPRVGSAETWKTFLDAGTQTEHGYGFGLMHLQYRGVRTIQHGGTVFGGRCQALKVPDHGLDVIMMSNASDVAPAELTDRVLDVLLEGKLGAPLAPATQERAQAYIGTYYSQQTGDEVTIFAKDGRAFVAGESGDLPLYESADGGFRTNVYSLGISVHAVHRRADDCLDAIELRQGGARALLQRVETPNRATIHPGTYENADCQARAIVTGGEQPRLRIQSRYGSAEYALEPLAAAAWYARLEHSWFPFKIRVEFAESDDGRSRLYLSAERTKRLEFVSIRDAK